MPKSMTGFGRSQTQHPMASVTWEARSVNSRYLDLKWRLPMFLRAFESDLEKVVRRHVDRGRLEVTCHFQPKSPEAMDVSLNTPLALAMIRAVSDLAGTMGQTFTPDFARLLGMPSLWQEGLAQAPADLLEFLSQGLGQAMEDLGEFRLREGRELARDIGQRLVKLRHWRDRIESLAPQAKEDKFQALRDRLAATLDKLGLEASEERVLQEVAMLSDKLDVSEEITRLAGHLDQIGELLGQDREVGKRLDFLLQEAFREINTCGNKVQNLEISRMVVEFKAELEKCREQVQNLE